MIEKIHLTSIMLAVLFYVPTQFYDADDLSVGALALILLGFGGSLVVGIVLTFYRIWA